MARRLLPLALLLFLPAAHASGEFYCCQDVGGSRSICGDTLPEQCRGRAYRILDSGGNVIKEISAPLTPAQKAEQAAEKERQKKLAEAAREKRLVDQALLDTYSTPEDIDISQKKAENDVDIAIRDAQENLKEAQEKRQKLNDEAEFYQKKTLPSDLDKELRAANHQVRVLEELIQVKQGERTTIRNKYEADRKRYFELTGRRSGKPAVTPPASSSTGR
ncbi:MAG: hypothetical protein LBE62_05925 [Azonexus sp.]|jgi:flagellar biosynthesis chaperone FliJ|nr:hypothetical protein [Azonexus sp.]